MNTPQAVSIASLLAAEDKQSGKDQLQHQLHNINDEDESAAREFEENLWKYSRLLLERGRFKQRWDPFIQLLVVYNSIFIPMSLAFAYQLAPNHQIADYCIDVLFIVDMVVSISTVYYNQHFELDIDRKQIVKHYLSTWFTIDLFSILPLELFANLVRDDEATRILVADFLKLPRMRLRASGSAPPTRPTGANLLRMVILCVLFIFAHLVAPLVVDRPDSLPGADVGTTTIDVVDLRMEARDRTQLLARNATAEGAFLAILADDDAGDAALAGVRGSDGGAERGGRRASAHPGRYLTSLYWALNALLKTPSIGPDTPLEKSFVTIVTIFGVLVFTIFVGNTIEVLQAVSHTDEARNKQMKMLTDFVHTARISRSLRSRIFAHSAAEYRSTLGINTSQLLHQFPRALRGQIVMYMHRQTLEACDLFGLLTTECAKALLLCVTPTVCLQKEVLVGRGELCEYLYILQRGALQVRDQDASDFEEAKADDAKDNFELTRQVYRKVKRMSPGPYNIGLPVPPPSAAPPRAQRRADTVAAARQLTLGPERAARVPRARAAGRPRRPARRARAVDDLSVHGRRVEDRDTDADHGHRHGGGAQRVRWRGRGGRVRAAAEGVRRDCGLDAAREQEATAGLRGSVAEPARWQLLQEGGARREESLADGRSPRIARRGTSGGCVDGAGACSAKVCLHLWRRRRRGRRRRHWILWRRRGWNLN